MSKFKKLVAYKVIHASSVKDLEEILLKWVNDDGYELQGGISDNGFHYRQTVVKYEEVGSEPQRS